MKKNFMDPEILVIELETEDIILSSFGDDETWWEDEL